MLTYIFARILFRCVKRNYNCVSNVTVLTMLYSVLVSESNISYIPAENYTTFYFLQSFIWRSDFTCCSFQITNISSTLYSSITLLIMDKTGLHLIGSTQLCIYNRLSLIRLSKIYVGQVYENGYVYTTLAHRLLNVGAKS